MRREPPAAAQQLDQVIRIIRAISDPADAGHRLRAVEWHQRIIVKQDARRQQRHIPVQRAGEFGEFGAAGQHAIHDRQHAPRLAIDLLPRQVVDVVKRAHAQTARDLHHQRIPPSGALLEDHHIVADHGAQVGEHVSALPVRELCTRVRAAPAPRRSSSLALLNWRACGRRADKTETAVFSVSSGVGTSCLSPGVHHRVRKR